MTYLNFDFAQARQNMVDNQLRPAEVNDTQLIEIMRILPREECVQASQREVAYADINLPISTGRFLSEPRVTARMVQLADIRPHQKVMIIGAATGYLAVIAYLLKAQVFAVEENDTLSKIGQSFCNKYAPEIQWYKSPLLEGCKKAGLVDKIIIDGAVSDVPQSLIDQLIAGGKIVTVLRKEDTASYAAIIEKTVNGMKTRLSFYASLPFLPELIK